MKKDDSLVFRNQMAKGPGFDGLLLNARIIVMTCIAASLFLIANAQMLHLF